MNDLVRYLKQIVEPTVDEFKRNPTSIRQAYLACVATFHAVDRASYPKKPSRLREEWGKKDSNFHMVDIVAHDFKHVRHVKSLNSKIPPPPFVLRRETDAFGTHAFGRQVFGDTGQQAALRHLIYVVQEAVKFLHGQAIERAGDGASAG